MKLLKYLELFVLSEYRAVAISPQKKMHEFFIQTFTYKRYSKRSDKIAEQMGCIDSTQNKTGRNVSVPTMVPQGEQNIV